MTPLLVLFAIGLAAGLAISEWVYQRRSRRLRENVANEFYRRLGALERERDERERILAHMTDGVALIDPQDRFTHANHRLASLLGAPLPPSAGTALDAYVGVAELSQLVKRARSEHRTAEAEVRLSGLQSLVRATATPVGTPGHEAVLLVLHDLTEIEQLSRVRQDFVANVSHELRTPLTSIRGYAETLLDGALEDVENRRQFVETIRDQTGRLSALVGDLLSIAELERTGATPRLTAFDLRTVAAAQVEAMQPAADRAHLRLSLEPGDPAPVMADRVRIEQVLANLLDNATKYTEEGGVTVRVGAEGAIAWGEVEDSGPGIPAEDLPRVFERFYRIDKARSRQKGGTGLGLSIVKHIVALHGGEVEVHPNTAGGSTFRFEIPRQGVRGVATGQSPTRRP